MAPQQGKATGITQKIRCGPKVQLHLLGWLAQRDRSEAVTTIGTRDRELVSGSHIVEQLHVDKIAGRFTWTRGLQSEGKEVLLCEL